jgi:hypothetical protein
MATKPKPLSESKRPRRRSGEWIRSFLACPFCRASEALHVVAYRSRSVRVECEACGGRFSFDPFQLADATSKLPPDEKGRPSFIAFFAAQIAGGVAAGHLRDLGWSPEQIREELAEHGIRDTR